MEAGDTGKEPAKPVDDEALKASDASEGKTANASKDEGSKASEGNAADTAKAEAEPSSESSKPDEKPTQSPKTEAEPATEPAKEPDKPSPKAKKAPAKPSPKSSTPADRRKLLRWGIVALAVLVAVIAWVATRDSGGGSSEPSSPEPAAPRVVTVDELREAAATLGQPIYWAGPVDGQELVLKELGEGGTQVLYVPEGTDAGKTSAGTLTIGSYPLSDPTAALEGFAKRPGSKVSHASDGREVVTSESSPTSVYFASPDNSVQVEVYDPSAQKAMSLALSGKVQPAG